MPALARTGGAVFNPYEDWVFAPETALFTVREHFKVASLDGFGLRDRAAAIGAAGAVLHYLTQHLRRNVSALTRLSFYQRARFHGAGPGHAAQPGNSGAAAPRRAAPRLALRRGQPHGHADGRAAPARLARFARWRQPGRFCAGATRCSFGWRTARRWTSSAANLAEVRDLERTLGRLSERFRQRARPGCRCGWRWKKSPRSRRCFSPWRPGRQPRRMRCAICRWNADAGVAKTQPAVVDGELGGQMGGGAGLWWS